MHYGIKCPESLKEGRVENERGEGKQTWGIDTETEKLPNEIE